MMDGEMIMKILVTGGTGFVGRKLLSSLVERGHQPRVLVMESEDTSCLPEQVTKCVGNLTDFESLREAVQDVEVVIHLAAYFDFYAKNKDLMYRVNVDGTRELMMSSAKAGVKRFIYCSTTETIGPVEYPPADETAELRPQFEYSKSKIAAEECVREITEETGLPHIIIRPTGIMGAGDLYTAYEIIDALNNGEISVLPGDGEKHLMYTHVSDIVDGFVKALTSTRALNETIILCPDQPMKYKDLIEFITTKLGVKEPTRRVPTVVAKLGIGLMSPFKNRGKEKSTFLWHMKTIESMDQDRWYSNARAEELLGWTPQVTMREGLDRSINWLWMNGHIDSNSPQAIELLQDSFCKLEHREGVVCIDA